MVSAHRTFSQLHREYRFELCTLYRTFRLLHRRVTVCVVHFVVCIASSVCCIMSTPFCEVCLVYSASHCLFCIAHSAYCMVRTAVCVVYFVCIARLARCIVRTAVRVVHFACFVCLFTARKVLLQYVSSHRMVCFHSVSCMFHAMSLVASLASLQPAAVCSCVCARLVACGARRLLTVRSYGSKLLCIHSPLMCVSFPRAQRGRRKGSQR